MRFRVKENACVGHARCATVAPEVYVLDDDGYLRMQPTVVPAGLEQSALRGARACPERAIVLEDHDSAPSEGR